MNNVFRGIRKLPVTAIVMETFYKLNSYFVSKRETAVGMERNNKEWTDMVMEKMEKRNNKARVHQVIPFNVEDGIYEVKTGVYGCKTGGQSRHVNFNDGTCTCKKPMLYHYPCSHLIAVCQRKGVNPEFFIHKHYSVDHFKRTYQESFYPIKNKEEWVDRNTIYKGTLVPPTKLIRTNASGRMKRGRRQEKRFKNDMDTMDNADRRKRCGNCGVPGHTRVRCPRNN